MQLTLKELAAHLGGQLEAPPDRVVSGLKGIEEAGPEDVTFVANPRYAKAMDACQAGVILVSREQEVPQGLPVIRVPDPYLAYAQLLTLATQRPYVPLGVSERAEVAASAVLGEDVSIHPLAYVGEEAVIGDRVVLMPGAYVGPGAQVGDDSVLHPNVVLAHGCRVGRRCTIHAGSVIGADGYGYAPDGDGYFKIPQIGIVQIDDDVEIGALVAIDRAATGRTWIQRGVKIDNLVMVAHNCVVGEDTLLVSQVGIAGSTKIGRHAVLGGQVGVAGHITVGDNVMAGGGTGVHNSLPDGVVVSGYPAMPHRLWLRTSALIKRLPDLYDRVKKLEAALAAAEDRPPKE